MRPLPLPPLYLCTRQWFFRMQCRSARSVKHGAPGKGLVSMIRFLTIRQDCGSCPGYTCPSHDKG